MSLGIEEGPIERLIVNVVTVILVGSTLMGGFFLAQWFMGVPGG